MTTDRRTKAIRADRIATEIPDGHTRISLLDPTTNAVLWSDTHKTEGGKVKNRHLLDGLREAFDNYPSGRKAPDFRPGI